MTKIFRETFICKWNVQKKLEIKIMLADISIKKLSYEIIFYLQCHLYQLRYQASLKLT